MLAQLTKLGQTKTQVAQAVAALMLLALSAPRSHGQDTPTSAAQTDSRRKVVVSIRHRKLALIEDGEVTKVYPVAVGAQESPSPTGSFEIRTRLVKPTYYHPGKVIPAGADNPLGTRWIGLNAKGYGIHGTNVESSIGKPASHGCIRMHREDLEQLFAEVQVGDQVEISDAPGAEIASIFGDPLDADSPEDAEEQPSAEGIAVQ